MRVNHPTPACFSSREEFREYVRLCRIPGNQVRGICEDCTPEYQAEMVAAGRCGEPGTIFVPVRVGGGPEVHRIGLSPWFQQNYQECPRCRTYSRRPADESPRPCGFCMREKIREILADEESRRLVPRILNPERKRITDEEPWFIQWMIDHEFVTVGPSGRHVLTDMIGCLRDILKQEARGQKVVAAEDDDEI